jgi:DNA-binding transcriptional MerR regulator
VAVTESDDGESRERGAAIEQAGQQGLLFGEDLSAHTENVGYRGPTACAAAGITYRQLDYWARTGLVEPSVRAAHGSGSQRLYGFRDILVLKVVKKLLDTGISLQQIRTAVNHLHDRGTSDLARLTLMSDGASVYECTSPDQVVDLLAGGQGVFGIARPDLAGGRRLARQPASRARRRERWPGGQFRRPPQPRRAGPAPGQEDRLTARAAMLRFRA